jgi:hypothetical protein
VCDAWKWHENKKQEDEDLCKILIENIEEEEELRGDENV